MAIDTDTITSVASAKPSLVEYPDSDGKPMSDNTLQLDTIFYIVGALRVWFLERLDVFVAGDLLWYYEEGNPKARIAPDGLVAFGRPPGYRGSYMQWIEGGVCPQVVFEVLSPKNTPTEMQRKYALYARLGCVEYYLIDPYTKAIEGFERTADGLTFIADAISRRSPLLELRLGFDEEIFRFESDRGETLKTMVEASTAAKHAERAAAEAQDRLTKAEEARSTADAARSTAEAARSTAEAARAAAEARAEAMAAKLRSLGLDPDA